MKPILIYTTCADQTEAEKIATLLLEKRLVACVKIIEKITSLYWWEGKINKSTETLCLIESRDELFTAIEKVIKDHHSYTTPVITKILIDETTKEVEAWLMNETKNYHDNS